MLNKNLKKKKAPETKLDFGPNQSKIKIKDFNFMHKIIFLPRAIFLSYCYWGKVPHELTVLIEPKDVSLSPSIKACLQSILNLKNIMVSGKNIQIHLSIFNHH